MDNADRQIDTGGGSYVAGHVNTQGGDFTGRDRIVHGDEVSRDKYEVHGDLIVGDGERVRLPSSEEVRAYLLAVQQAYARWADRPEPGPPPPSAAAYADEQPDTFVALRAMAELPTRVARFVDQPGDSPPPAQDLLAALAGQRRAIILGDPGSGKSTALERIAWATATASLAAPANGPGVVPILARLIDYSGGPDLVPLLRSALARAGLALASPAAAEAWLRSRDMQFVVLLDGLNELLPGLREQGLAALRAYPTHFPEHLVRLTCRTADFNADAQDDRSTRIPADGLPWVIQELVDAAEHWGDTERPSDVRDYLRGHVEDDDAAKRIWDQLHADERLGKLARNPLFLWMIMKTGTEGGSLPRDRGALVCKFVRWGTIWRLLDPDLRGLAERCLEDLGDHMQQQGVLQIDEAGLLERFDAVRGKRSETPDAIRRALHATGLLTHLPGDIYEFRHQLIQEYAAAAYLIRQPDCGAQLARRARDEWWRETTVMALWLGRKLHTPAYLQGLMGEPAVDLRVRIAAATILGQVGDPRFLPRPYQVSARSGDPSTHTVQAIEPAMVTIPAGLVLLGGEDPDADSDELPQSQVQVAAFELAIYPVTNAEFTCFMKDQGYEQPDLWMPAGQAWLRGESRLDPETEKNLRDTYQWLCNDLENILADWKQSRSMSEEEIANWRVIATEWSEDDYVEEYNRQVLSEQRREPFYLHDNRFNAKTQPVVGVNWYEAMAYAAWLARTTGKPYRLPTEAEWEWAARRNVRRYPWDDAWDSARCNSSESRLGQPSPVGVYPLGATPDGLHDLSGNVYEWTATLYHPYRYDPADGREDPLPDGIRAARGGSWYVGRTNVRCAYRRGDVPGLRIFDLGCRVARSLE
jgi:formylglycine-generating enzyme required for sulfatase activity